MVNILIGFRVVVVVGVILLLNKVGVVNILLVFSNFKMVFLFDLEILVSCKEFVINR